jgi:hypothetical protein
VFWLDADGVGLNRDVECDRGSAAVICCGDGVRASPLVNNTQPTYESSDSRVVKRWPGYL